MKEQLKSLRQEKGLTIKFVAQQLDVDAAIVSRFENGDRLPTDEQVRKLAEILGVPFNDLAAEWLKEKIMREVKQYTFADNALSLVQEALAEYKKRSAYVYSGRLEDVLKQIDALKDRLDELRPLNSYRVAEALDIEYTFESNRIEGNTLTLMETSLVVNEGLTIAGKSMREHLEAVNHKDALDYVKELVDKKTPLNERELLNIHNLVLRGIMPQHAGKYRDVQVMISGSAHTPPEPLLVAEKMAECFAWYRAHESSLHPVILAAEMHERIVSIHPFVDGNGRTSRLFMNLILLRNGYIVANIKGDYQSRMNYYRALEDVQGNKSSDNFNHFCAVVEKECLENYISVLSPGRK